MLGPPRSDERLLYEAARSLWSLENLENFRAAVPAQLHGLLACTHASYNEIGDHPDDVLVRADPAEALESEELLAAFQTFALQNPLAAHHLQTGATRTLRLSDFAGARELHALDLYDLVYKPLGVEYQLAFNLPARDHVIAVTVSRDSKDFSNREVALLDSVSEIVRNVYRNLHDRARLALLTQALEGATEPSYTILLVEACGAITPAHERAEATLAALAREGGSLGILQQWARAERRAQPRGRRSPLTVRTRKNELHARYLHGTPGSLDAIYLSPPSSQHTALRTLGLTDRQAEVLHLVWRGQSNTEIALTLDISQHTILRHLEGIYGRLGVRSRTRAMYLAGRVLRDR